VIRFISKKSINIATQFKSHPKITIGGAERQMILLGSELTKRGNINFHYITIKQFKTQKKKLKFLKE